MSRPDVLFVHSNFPGQFAAVAGALAGRGWRCAAIGGPSAPGGGLPIRRWSVGRGSTPGLYTPATRAEADMLRGRAALDAALALKGEGFDPALIIGHPGWGETLFLHEVFPRAKLILHGEFYYRAEGADVGFDPEFPAPDLDERVRVEAKNATLGLAYLAADRIVVPTRFQASVFPSVLKPRLRLIHEGIDTARIAPRRVERLALPDGRTLEEATPTVTFVNRNLEPLRGFHVFMRALPALLQAAPDAHAIVIGAADGRGYGLPSGDRSWKDRLLQELEGRLDLSRVHFMGKVPHGWMLDAMAMARAHVYYTYPFVLSWSLLEAMALECLVLGSDTAPVRDAVVDGQSGLLRPFFDVEALSRGMIDACRAPERFAPLRRQARRAAVRTFDQASVCLPAWLSTVDEVLAVRAPRARGAVSGKAPGRRR